MAAQDTTVVYKAIANFTALNAAIDKTKAKIKELRAEEAKANAQSLAEADFLSAAQAGRNKDLDDYSKKLKSYKALVESVAKAEQQIGTGSGQKLAKWNTDLDKLNERLEKTQKLLRESTSPAPPAAGTKTAASATDAAKINKLASAIQAHAAANVEYAASAAAANRLRASESKAYDKLATSLASYSAARLAANAADAGAVGAPFPMGSGEKSGSKFGPGAMPPKGAPVAAGGSSATNGADKEVIPGTGLEKGTSTVLDSTAASLGKLTEEIKANNKAEQDAELAASKLTTGLKDLGRGAKETEAGARVAEKGVKDLGKGVKEAETIGSRFKRVMAGIGSSFSGWGGDIKRGISSLEGWGNALSKAGTKSVEFLNFGWRAPLVVIIPLIAAIIGLVNPLVAILGAAAAAAGGLGESFASLAGTALALPGILGAVVAGVSSVMVAMRGITGSNGVFAAMGAVTQAKKTAATNTSSRLDPLTPAQQNVIASNGLLASEEKLNNSSKANQISQLKNALALNTLTDSRKKAKAVLDGLIFSQQQLNTLQAVANVQSAKENLANVMASSSSTKGDKLQAQAQYLQAQYNLQHPNASANSGVQTAQNTYQAALDKLSPAAKAFVLEIQKIKPAWQDMQKGVQQDFFSQFQKDLPKLKTGIDELGGIWGKAAKAMGKIVDKLLILFTSPQWQKDLGTIGDDFATILGSMGDGLVSLADGLKDLVVAAGPFAKDLVKHLADGAKHLADLVSGARKDHSLQDWLKLVETRLGKWLTIIGNIAGTIFNFGKAMGSGKNNFSDWVLNGFLKMTKGWEDASKNPKVIKNFQDFLKNVEPILSQLSGLFGDFFKWFGKTASDNSKGGPIKQAVQIIKDLRDIGKAAAPVFDTLTHAGISDSVLQLIKQLIDLVGIVMSNGGAATIKFVLTSLIELLKELSGFASTPVGGVIVTAFVVLAGLSFLGVFKVVGMLGKLSGMTFKGVLKLADAINGLKAEKLTNAAKDFEELDKVPGKGPKRGPGKSGPGETGPEGGPGGTPGSPKGSPTVGSGTQKRPWPTADEIDQVKAGGPAPKGWLDSGSVDANGDPILNPDPDYIHVETPKPPQTPIQQATDAAKKDAWSKHLAKKGIPDTGATGEVGPDLLPPESAPELTRRAKMWDALTGGLKKSKGGSSTPAEVADLLSGGGKGATYDSEIGPLTRKDHFNTLRAGGEEPAGLTEGSSLDPKLGPDAPAAEAAGKPSFFKKFSDRLKNLKNNDDGFIRLGGADPAQEAERSLAIEKKLAERRASLKTAAEKQEAEKAAKATRGGKTAEQAGADAAKAGKGGDIFSGISDAIKGTKLGGGIAGIAEKIGASPVGKLLKVGGKFLGPLGALFGGVDTGFQVADAAGSKGDRTFLNAIKKGNSEKAVGRLGTDILGGALRGGMNGAAIGALLGSVIPGAGTLAGGVIGGGIGTVVGGGIDAVKAIGPKNLARGWNNIVKDPSLIGKGIGSLADGAGKVIGSGAKNWVSGVGIIGKGVVGANKQLTNFFKPVQDWMNGIQKSIANTWNSFLHGGGKGKGAWPGVLNVFSAKNFGKAMAKLGNFLKPVADFFSQVFADIKLGWDVLLHGGKIGNFKWPGLLSAFDPKNWPKIGDVLGTVWDSIKSFVADQIKGFTDFFGGVGDFISNAWNTVFGGGTKKPTKPTTTSGSGGTPGTSYQAEGGIVRGVGGSRHPLARGTDTVPTMLTPGEFIMRKAAVDRIGQAQLYAMNNGQAAKYFASGGLVGADSLGLPSGINLGSTLQQSVSSPTVNDRSITIQGMVINNPRPETSTTSVARKLRQMAYYGSTG